MDIYAGDKYIDQAELPEHYQSKYYTTRHFIIFGSFSVTNQLEMLSNISLAIWISSSSKKFTSQAIPKINAH